MVEANAVGSVNIHGSCTKSDAVTVQLPNDFGTRTDPDDFHIAQIGRLIESNEDTLRSTVQDTYLSKQR